MTAEPVDHAAAAHRAAEERLAACWAFLHEEADAPPPDQAAPFCGCPTCEVREALDAAYPHLRAQWEAEREADDTATDSAIRVAPDR